MLLSFVLPAPSLLLALTTATTMPLYCTPRLEPSPATPALPAISALMPPLPLWSALPAPTPLLEPCLAALRVRLVATPELEPITARLAPLVFPATTPLRTRCLAQTATTQPTAL